MTGREGGQHSYKKHPEVVHLRRTPDAGAEKICGEGRGLEKYALKWAGWRGSNREKGFLIASDVVEWSGVGYALCRGEIEYNLTADLTKPQSQAIKPCEIGSLRYSRQQDTSSGEICR